LARRPDGRSIERAREERSKEEWMYKERHHLAARSGSAWVEMLGLFGELNKTLESKGLTQSRIWTQSWGNYNELVLEAEYPDLATLEKERAMFFGDPDLMGTLKKLEGLSLEGGGHSELWETAEPPQGM
jgi:hypothetical protein